MQKLFNIFGSVGDAIEYLDKSLTSVIELIEYIPAVLGSAIIVFLVIYVVRFCLLK